MAKHLFENRQRTSSQSGITKAEAVYQFACDITQRTLAYTNHTLLPEALEKWPLRYFQQMLPRHLEIILEINRRFLDDVRRRYPGDEGRVGRVSLIEEGPEEKVRMANLAIVGSHSTNGVAAIHSELLRTITVRDLAEMFPERFNNKTNGVTPRRWLLLANPELARTITGAIGDGWTSDLSQLSKLKPLENDSAFRSTFLKAKRDAKCKFADWLRSTSGQTVDPDTIFDCQIKRIHEYKRQLLNPLRIIVLYTHLRENPDLGIPPRTFFFAGKAAPAYHLAKLIIKFINNLAGTVDGDPVMQGRLKLVFLPDYNVSLAERLIPAADVSNQISTAGYEASGTSNMKFMMNGALTLGTRDGATIEMAQEVGEENFFLFGLTAQQVEDSRSWYSPRWHYDNDPETRTALDLIASNYLSRYEPGIFAPIHDALLAHGDHYMHLADLKSYLDADQRLCKLYADGVGWARKAILNVAGSGKFSSDRTIAQYAAEIWNATTLSGALERTTQMDISPLAGKPAPREMLVDLSRLEREYFECRPDLDDPEQLVSFGTSGHRGSPFLGSFTEAHILAITQAICDYRRARGIDGPLYVGKDTHALSGPAQCTALEVLAANEVQTIIQQACGVTPTPVISHAILVHNRSRTEHLADGIVITPSHNPPEDGGFKYNPTHGGPADTHVTQWIENRANEILRNGNECVRRVGFEEALLADTTHQRDFVLPYVKDLRNVVDMEAIQAARLKLAVDPLGGAAVHYWEPINTIYKPDIAVVNRTVGPALSFMTVDHDGKIRMDCSSPYAMARLVGLKDRYRVAFANDPDSDRHGIVTPSAGLMNPNHYLAVAISYLLTHRPRWPAHAAVGKTLVSSSIIDRVVNKLGRGLSEVPVGFKWFVPGLFDGSCCFGGEESAGASFLRHDGGVWTTDKDGPIVDLLAAEITARTGKDSGEHYRALTAEFGTPLYTRIDQPATAEQKSRLEKLSPAAVKDSTLAGEPITAKLSRAPGNEAPIDGLKVIARSGWFAARPSGTEAVYNIYAESFKDEAHLNAIVTEAQAMVNKAVAFSG